nr:hypothetical protein [Atlantibacter hermannii]
MTVQLTAVEAVSDALFACSYLWAHGRPYSRSDLDKAIHQHKDPSTRYGKLVAKLTQLHSMTYEELCEAGYMDKRLKHMVKQKAGMPVLQRQWLNGQIKLLLEDV